MRCHSLNCQVIGRGEIEASCPPETVSKRELKVTELNQNNTIGAEWGAINNVRFFLSSVASLSPNASALGNTVYNVMIMGMEAICCVAQDNFSSRFLYRPPALSDPLFQNVTMGYVFAEVPRILNDLWINNMRCTTLVAS